MNPPSARQPIFEVVNGSPVFTRPWYLFLTGQPTDASEIDIEGLQQLPMSADNSSGLAVLTSGLMQTPSYEELRSLAAEQQKQLDALAQVPA